MHLLREAVRAEIDKLSHPEVDTDERWQIFNDYAMKTKVKEDTSED